MTKLLDAESARRRGQFYAYGEIAPPKGDRHDTLLDVAHYLAERNWSNDQIWLRCSTLGREWGIFNAAKPYQEAVKLRGIIVNVRKHVPNANRTS